MYTIDDKNYLSLIKTNNKDTYDYIMHLIDEYRSDLQKGCHDIRNVLALLVGNLGLIELTHNDLVSDNRWNQIKEDLNYLVKLMNDITRIRYANVIHKSEFNYEELLNHITASYDLSINVTIDSDISHIIADKQSIEYILRALLDNIYECNSKSEVNIHIYFENNKIYTSVSDNLPEIDKDTQIKLFHLFNTTKQNHSGLSLATASMIMTAHDREISYSYNDGNIFCFCFKS